MSPPKDVQWLGSSREALRALPGQACQRLGFALWRVQEGRVPHDWKPMPAIGPGVIELRANVNGAYRLILVAKWPEAIYVLHVFQKKSRRTLNLDIELARRRYANVRRSRDGEEGA